MSGFLEKYNEAQYNLDQLGRSFAQGDSNFVHCLNNFLSSAQSIIWTLNKSFSKVEGYSEWIETRSSRLPDSGKIFKELRNVSLKEQPIKHDGIITNFDFGANGIIIPPHAEVLTPWFDTARGILTSDEATINTIDGNSYQVKPLIIHDFSVSVISGKKEYKIDRFITTATEYLNALRKEIVKSESKFN